MHPSALENMQKCYERYICGAYYQKAAELSVLDIGGRNALGSYADIFSATKFRYVAADVSPVRGVDVVLDDLCKLPFEDNSIDVVISGQTLERAEFFWVVFAEMARVVKEDGWILLVASSGGPAYRSPVDCYRFRPDAYYALAKYAGVNLVNVFRDERGPWKDLVGVFSKSDVGGEGLPTDVWRPVGPSEMNRFLLDGLPASTDIAPQSEETERTGGEVSYLEVLNLLHTNIMPSAYLEIGVRRGASLSIAKCRAIAIDPEPAVNVDSCSHINLFKMPSDYFFEHLWPAGSEGPSIDLAFIDGMHLFEFVLRDFMNLEARSSENTVIAVDDVFPNHIAQATRKRNTQVWAGDVWKFLVCLRECRPDLELTMIDTYPTGMLVIRGLDRNNRTLVDHYNPIVTKYRQIELGDYEDLILYRREAIPLSGNGFEALLRACSARQ